MFTDLENARAILEQENCTCVVCKGSTVYQSTRRGVAPLMQWLESGTNLTRFCAADKVVGKATALLYCLLGTKAVYARVISQSALRVFTDREMPCFYEALVPAIRNRAGDGLCPMEQATRDIEDPRQAPDAIRAALHRLTQSG